MNIAIIDGIQILFSNLGGLMGGYLVQHYGFQLPYYIVTGLFGTCFVYIIVVIRDRIPRGKGDSKGYCQLLSVSHLRENFETLRKARPGETRLHIYILLFCLLIYSICTLGEYDGQACRPRAL